jgi:hypothetical protein
MGDMKDLTQLMTPVKVPLQAMKIIHSATHDFSKTSVEIHRYFAPEISMFLDMDSESMKNEGGLINIEEAIRESSLLHRHCSTMTILTRKVWLGVSPLNTLDGLILFAFITFAVSQQYKS